MSAYGTDWSARYTTAPWTDVPESWYSQNQDRITRSLNSQSPGYNTSSSNYAHKYLADTDRYFATDAAETKLRTVTTIFQVSLELSASNSDFLL